MPEVVETKVIETKFLKQFKAARNCSVPLVAVETADQASTIRQIKAISNGDPMLSWDIISGLKPFNEKGVQAIGKMTERDPATMNNPAETLGEAVKLPADSILFFLNGHRYIGDRNTSEAAVGQAIWNLRDVFKRSGQMLVILCPGIQLPEELKMDVLVLSEPLPENEELKGVALTMHKDAQLPLPDEQVISKAVDATKGLSLFSAEQVIAMSMSKKGLDLEALWERKRKAVEQTPGLTIYRGKETFDNLRGVEVAREFLTRIFSGRIPPSNLVFMDEIEKMFAGIQGDLSGTSQEQHGEFLRWMQDNEVLGMMLVGHPGCTKSFLAKCCAGQFSIPMVELNMTALKGSLVGQTGLQTRNALKVISAIGRPLVLATSNSLAVLPPELRRRFQLGTFFFDLPTSEERNEVWKLYVQKYQLQRAGPIPEDEGWTPAEIKTCCDIAWRLNCLLKGAAQYIVPICRSAPDKVEQLRQQAHNRFLSASTPGVYQYGKLGIVEEGLRKMKLGDVGEA